MSVEIWGLSKEARAEIREHMMQDGQAHDEILRQKFLEFAECLPEGLKRDFLVLADYSSAVIRGYEYEAYHCGLRHGRMRKEQGTNEDT